MNAAAVDQRPTVREFLSSYQPYVRAIVQRLRALVRHNIPDHLEVVHPGWKLIGYRVSDGTRDYYFAFIAPRKETVVLGFEYGRMLSDPENILTGSGRQVRQVEVRSKKEVRVRALSSLIVEAAMAAVERGRVRKRVRVARRGR